MKVNSTKSAILLAGGWFIILTAAGIFLVPTHSKTPSVGVVPSIFLALSAIWVLLTGSALTAYLYRQWRRTPLVPNKISFVTWLTFVSVCALASLSGLVWIFVPNYSDSLKQERERVLRQDLLLMRSLISQYTLDKKQRPHSLHDMAAAGYLKNVPRDPFTGRNDTWIVKCSSDLSTPGIVGIESGYGNATNNAAHECD